MVSDRNAETTIAGLCSSPIVFSAVPTGRYAGFSRETKPKLHQLYSFIAGSTNPLTSSGNVISPSCRFFLSPEQKFQDVTFSLHTDGHAHQPSLSAMLCAQSKTH